MKTKSTMYPAPRAKTLFFVLSSLFTFHLLNPCFAQDIWTQKQDFGGTERRNAVGFSIGTKGYIGTGNMDDGSFKKDFWEYDPGTNTWTQKADFGGTARQGAVGFSIGTKGYIGTGFSGARKKDFWEYDPGTNTWTQKQDFGGTARHWAVGFSIGTKGYIGTGNDGGYTKDFWEYNPSTNSWTPKADFGGTARWEAVGFSIGSKGYIGTGRDGTNKKDFWEYDPGTNIWTQKQDFGGTARSEAVGFAIGSKGYIGTGYDGVFKKDFWEYDPGTNTWTQKQDFGGTVRFWAVGFSIGTKGYIGTGDNGTFYKDFWEYAPDVGLPVELLSFDAIPVKKQNNEYYVRCNWSTATEINNDYFSIEKSTDGKTFEQIGTRQGSGNSNTTLHYRFDDEHPYIGVSYYQLKQTDYDGKFSYSNIVAVYIGEMDIINISPSPAEKEIEYIIKISETSLAQVKVSNVLGQAVINQTETIEKGVTQKKLDISMLASGYYMLSINAGQLGTTEKKFAVK